MSNILNHNRNIFDLKIDKSEYWDFHLSLDDTSYSHDNNADNNDCLSINVDFNDPECMWFDEFYSKQTNLWDKAINNGLTLDSIGFTGVDNGLLTYEKDSISNKEFLDIFLNSTYSIESDDMRFHFHKVNGNNQIFDYSNSLVFDNDTQVIELNGGFYQGFFKSGDDYQIFPINIETQWKFSFDLKPSSLLTNDKYTLNDKHPDNKGMFFYIGTRAENKWWKRYNTNINENYDMEKYVTDDYLENNIYEIKHTNSPYLEGGETCHTEQIVDNEYIKDGYINIDCNTDNVIEDGYLMDDIELNTNISLTTKEGYDLYQPNITEIKTDNKFITYHHGKDGFCANENNDDKEVVIYDIKTPNIENYFLLFNRTCNGYTTCNIQEHINEKSKDYDILADLYNNALGFQIKDNGSIGFKYMVKDCENGGYKIESLFSKPDTVLFDKWSKIEIKIINKKPKTLKCQYASYYSVFNKMQIQIFVNNKLVLVSKDLPMLNLRKLNDLDSKQEGVPFNISIGGGTQGLCDMVDIDYMTPPSDILPIEKEFGGSFIGYIRTFGFYSC